MALAILSTFDQIRRQVQLLTGNRCDQTRAGEAINLVLQGLWNDYSWSYAKTDTTLTLTGAKQDGLVSLNLNPRLINGWGTSFTTSDIGSYLRLSSESPAIRVTAVQEQRLTLETAYTGVPFLGQTYTLFRHLYTLPQDFREFLSPTYWDHLKQVTQQQLDEWDPLRLQMDTWPVAYAMRGLDRNFLRQVELWPIPAIPLLIRYSYMKSLPRYSPLDGSAILPLRGDMLAYLAAGEALMILAAEARNTKDSSLLVGLGERWLTLGRHIVQEAYYADRSVFGVPDSVPEYHGYRGLDMGSYCTFLPLATPAVSGGVILGDERYIGISWVEFEVPVSPLDARKVLISWVELEHPGPASSIQVSWLLLETPDAPPRQMLISWVEFEVPTVIAPREVWISWVELELPAGPDRQLLIGWVEFEVPVPIDRAVRISWLELEAPAGPERRVLIGWVELELPEVTAPRAVLISWVEMETPETAERAIRIGWVEMETP